jgi:tetratricopeptide (TPR) repeat protein
MQSEMDQTAKRSSGSDVLKWLKRVVFALFVLVAVIISAALIRGDSWSKMKARAAAKGQIDYYIKREGPNGPNTLPARRSLVWLLIHQKFPAAARTENNRYLADLKRIHDPDQDIQNDRFLTACEFRSSGFLDIAFEEFSAIEAEDGYSYGGLNTSQWVIITLMEQKRYAEAETKCQQMLDTPEKLALLRKYDLWDPWAKLAECLVAQGRHSNAEPAFNRAIAASAESRGTNDYATQYLRVQLAHSLAAMGRNEEALALARQALPAFENYQYSSSKSIQKLREFIARLDRLAMPASF